MIFFTASASTGLSDLFYLVSNIGHLTFGNERLTLDRTMGTSEFTDWVIGFVTVSDYNRLIIRHIVINIDTFHFAR